MADIQPFEYQKSTNIEEHKQIADKVNEIVEVINDLDVEGIDPRISALETDMATVKNNVSTAENDISNLEVDVAKAKTDITEIDSALATAESDITELMGDVDTINADVTKLENADVTAIDASIEGGAITIRLNRPMGNLSDSVTCPFISTASLIPTSTERAFKIRFAYTDGTQYDTNDFVIPEGGGTDVSVTGVTVEDGTAENSFKVAIQLSDASTIASNDYVVSEASPYPTAISGTLNDNTLNLTLELNNGTAINGTADLSGIIPSKFITEVEMSGITTTDQGYIQTLFKSSDGEQILYGITETDNGINVVYRTATDSKGSTMTAVKTVTGSVSNNKLVVGVNGVNSQPITLPSISGNKKQLVTSGDITQFITYNPDSDTVEIIKDFDIEYMRTSNSNSVAYIKRIPIYKGAYIVGDNVQLGNTFFYEDFGEEPYRAFIYIERGHSPIQVDVMFSPLGSLSPASDGNATISYETTPNIIRGYKSYRLFSDPNDG